MQMLHSVCPKSRQASKSLLGELDRRWEKCPKDDARGRSRRPRRSISGTARGRANCACSAATPAARCISHRGRSAPLARRATSPSSRRAAKGRLYSYVIHHRPVPGFTPPYAIAVVELDEGPRMMTNITGCSQTPEALELDMPVEIAFEKLDDEITLPLFRPARR